MHNYDGLSKVTFVCKTIKHDFEHESKRFGQLVELAL